MSLELNDEQLDRNDDIDNAVHGCLCTLAEKNLEWNMEIIAKATEQLKDVLLQYGIKVRHPAIATNEDGTEEYVEYD